MRKWLISQAVSSTRVYVIKRLTENYDHPRQYINFSGQIFHIRPHSGSRDLYTSGVPPLADKFLPLTRRRPAVPCGAYLFH